MKVSKHWLNKFFDQKLPTAEVLAEVLTFHAFEIDGITKMGGDDVLDVKVTPNRGHDALSHRAFELLTVHRAPVPPGKEDDRHVRKVRDTSTAR